MAAQLLLPPHKLALPTTPPDVIEFVCSDQYLGRSLYPRQATLLKAIFLQLELMTQYDYDVLGDWAGREFTLPPAENWDVEKPYRYVGQWGIQPDILERIDINRREGRKWFREVLAVIGRRGGKGYIGALAGAYVLWHYICLMDPQAHYAIDRDKRLAALVFAGKKEQAKQNQWRDLINVLIGAPCFQPYISQSLGESLTMHSKVSLGRGAELASQGVKTSMDLASFEVLPKEATPMAGRGVAGFVLFFDEMAHVVATGASRGADELYDCLDPDTLVLTADLDWVRIADLRPGDALVGYDEHAEAGAQRKLREATVVGTRVSRSAPVRMTFDDGSTVVCSDNHRWLKVQVDASGALKDAKWATAGAFARPTGGLPYLHLKVGDHIRYIADPWERDDTRDGGYVAGIFDGEGHLCTTAASTEFSVAFSQKPGLVLDKTLTALESLGYHPRVRSQGDSGVMVAHVTGIEEMLRLLGSLRPERLLAKAREAWVGKTPRGAKKYKTIVSMERLPEQDLIDIETSTGTFIAAGLVSHNSATPSLDQFGTDGFIYAGSSPWQMLGKYYELVQQALEVEYSTLEPVHPDKLIVQLTSWDIYEDWDRAHKIQRIPATDRTYHFLGGPEPDPVTTPALGFHYIFARAQDDTLVPVRSKTFDPIARPIQVYDAHMARLERANPETFAVERRSRWAASLDNYLNPVLVDRMFEPYMGRTLQMAEKGILSRVYVAHGDPSKSGANFGWAIAHAEGPDHNGFMHVVFDKIHFWAPWSFDDGQIDYVSVEKEILRDIKNFRPELVTFDQFSSGPIMSHLRQGVVAAKLPKRVTIDERTATAPQNWAVAETFKTAIGLDLVHMPYFEQIELECKFLQVKGNKVDHPSMGPVQTKDVWDAVSNCVWSLIGSQMEVFLRSDLSRVSVQPAGQQMAMGQVGSQEANFDREIFDALGSANRRRRPADSAYGPRGPRGWG